MCFQLNNFQSDKGYILNQFHFYTGSFFFPLSPPLFLFLLPPQKLQLLHLCKMQLLEYMGAKSSLAVMLVFLALKATPFFYFIFGTPLP